MSFSIDEEIRNYLREHDQINNSGLVNQFLREYLATGTVDGIQFRLDRIDSEIEETRSRLERLKEEREQLQKIKERREQEREADFDEIVDQLTTISYEKLDKDNPAIVAKANELNMTPRELAEVVIERKEADTYSFESISRGSSTSS